jgi:DNA transformation protein and related proteins
MDHFVEHCLELLAPLGAPRARRMFGGHGLYVDDVFVALVAFERLYLKVDADSAPHFAAAGCEPFVYDAKGRSMTMSYHSAPPEAMESPALMAPWARLALQAALRARQAKAGAVTAKKAAAARKTDASRIATTAAARRRARASH